MSTRIVEQDLTWCRSRVVEVLTECGFSPDSAETETSLIRARYTRVPKGSLLYRPKAKIRLSRVPEHSTSVEVSFSLRLGLMALLVAIRAVTGLGFFLVVGLILPNRLGLPNHISWVPFVVSAAWALFFIGRGAYASEAVEKYCRRVETSIWERVDPDSRVSHEVSNPSPSERKFFSAEMSLSLGMTLTGGVLLVTNIPLLDMIRRGAGVLLLVGGISLLLLYGLVTWSHKLPHRYHWKLRFAATYMNWWLVVCFPVLALMGLTFVRAWSRSLFGEPSFSRAGRLFLTAALGAVVVAYGVLVVAIVRVLMKGRRRENVAPYFEPPSARWEAFSEEQSTSHVKSVRNLHILWTWAVFLTLTLVWYVAAGYLAVTFVGTAAGSLGAPWALALSRFWPVVLPSHARAEAVQALVLACLAGAPLGMTVALAARGRLRLRKRFKLGLELAGSSEALGLPEPPLAHLKRELKADALRVALVPAPGINMQVERSALFNKEYLLWVSVGAKKKLSQQEMEALLWHECGHAAFIKKTAWREIVSLIAVWAPRFLDLAEDLYDQERRADLYAVRKMGTAQHLSSALLALQGQETLFNERTEKPYHVDPHQWFSGEALKMIWSLGWVGYLHPDLRQRLQWLEACEADVAPKG
jgi:Zn-dependent protease with chaperone function